MRQLANESAQASFAAAMAQLRPTDEAAVYASRDWFVGKPEAVTPLTQDREALSRALATALQYAADTTAAERRADRASRTPSMENVVREATDIARLKPQFHTAVVYSSDGMNTLDSSLVCPVARNTAAPRPPKAGLSWGNPYPRRSKPPRATQGASATMWCGD